MKFLPERFMNTEEECSWLRDTHLKGVGTVPFASFTLSGDRKAPARLDLYKSQKPPYNEHPAMVLVRIDGELVLAPPVERKPKKQQEPVSELAAEQGST